MIATSLVFNMFCVLSGLLVCLPPITSTLASVSPSASSDLLSSSTNSGFNVTQLGLPLVGNYSGVEVTQSKSAVSSNNRKNSSVGVKTAATRSMFDRMTQAQTSRKLNPKALLRPQLTLDKIYLFIDTVNNIMNGNTSTTQFNRMMQAYGVLYTSPGAQALNNFLNMWVSVFTVLDAVANIFRAYETRFNNARNENHPPEPSANPMEDLQDSLDDVNRQVEVVSDLFQTLARMGESDDSERRDGEGGAKPAQSLMERAESPMPKDSVIFKGVNVQPNNYLPNPSQLETNRHLLFHPANFGAGIGNTGIPYDSTTGNNPVGGYSRHNQGFPVKRTNRQTLFALHESTPKTTQQLHLRASSRSYIRSQRSYVDYDYGIDRFVYVMRKMNNVLNSNTNNRQLNRFTESFNNLFASNGLIAFNTFYTLLASFWTVIDAVTNVFRFNEARIRDGIQRSRDQNKPADPLADLQTELDDTNANLDEVVKLVTTMDEAAARLETLTGSEFDRSGVTNKKKNNSKKHGSRRRRKPSRPTTPQPTTRHSYNPVTHRSYSAGTRNQSLIPSKAGANHHIQPAPAISDRWQPVHYKSPIIMNPQQSSSTESFRNIYYPVVNSHAGHISNNPNNSLPSSTNTTKSNHLNAVKHSAAVGLDPINPQRSSIPANRYAMNYDHRRSNHHQQSSFENNRQSNERPKYNSWVGLSAVDNKPVVNNTGRVYSAIIA
ncbi:hypothetical protein DAPPUDRAFT_97176 [Daphnia pulex]|uniref:Uncharacterized protein n=1 Tax=Daphnia pulex TaxID=6669 RepID=E9G0W5_DAPPU|nr:hypothetical protein DAPPUDRAFT_97176 [Daphnia pulex]|eukprot:EFX86978.1 hypothetical protein DAPPUDRAFT_97176 [Daphnia pulex]